MANEVPRISTGDATGQLNERARELWGDRRAEELRQPLEDTARILAELRRNFPDKNVEPGFYP